METKSMIYLGIYLFMAFCWIVNCVKFCSSDFEEPYTEEIVYGIGLVTPAFYATCWLDFEQERLDESW